jgi:hypothetical protein
MRLTVQCWKPEANHSDAYCPDADVGYKKI